MTGTLNDYFLKHRTKGLEELAQRAGTKLSYLRQLNHNPNRRPSMEMAEKLVKASEGEITFEGLNNPQKRLLREPETAASRRSGASPDDRSGVNGKKGLAQRSRKEETEPAEG